MKYIVTGCDIVMVIPSICIIMILVLVLLLRMSVLSSKQQGMQANPLSEEHLPKISFDAVHRLSDMIKFQTISYDSSSRIDYSQFSKALDYIKSAFPMVHKALKVQTFNSYSILFTWEGTRPDLKPLLFLAHSDVVPVEEKDLPKWTHPPFSGHIDTEYIWGRGAMDNKVNAMALLESVEAMLEQNLRPNRTICIAIGHDEEIGGSSGAQCIARQLKAERQSFEFIMDEGLTITRNVVPGVSSPVALVGIAEKGYLSVELKAEVTSGHASMPPKETAIGILCRGVERLQANRFPPKLISPVKHMFERLASEMPFIQKLVFSNLWILKPLVIRKLSQSSSTNALIRTTVAPTIISGGVKDNVLPLSARAIVNCRLLPGETFETVLETISKILGNSRISVSICGDTRFEPSAISPIDNASFRGISQAISTAFPGVLTAPALMIAGTDSRHYSALSQSIYRFTPVFTTQEDLSRIHGIDERISIDNYLALIRFYICLMTKL